MKIDVQRRFLRRAMCILCFLCIAGSLGSATRCSAADEPPSLDMTWTPKASSQVAATSTTLVLTLRPEVSASSVQVGLGVNGSGAFILPAIRAMSNVGAGSTVAVGARLIAPPESSGTIVAVITGTDTAGHKLFQRRAAVPFTNVGGKTKLGTERLSGDKTLSLALSAAGCTATPVYQRTATITVTPSAATPVLSVSVVAEGGVVLRDQGNTAWTGVAAGETKSLDVAFWIPVGESGVLVASANAMDASGKAVATQQASLDEVR